MEEALFIAVISILVAIVWGCVLAVFGVTGWLLLIICSIIFVCCFGALSICAAAS